MLNSYQDFWNLPESEWGNEYRMRLEVSVLFHDPGWSILWLENEGLSFFCQPGTNRFDIRQGQKALLECRASPSRGFVPEALQFTVIGEGETLEPRDALQLLDQPDQLDLQRVRFVGLVESQRNDDPQHLSLQVTLGRYIANVIVAQEPSGTGRNFDGRLVEVDGFCTLRKRPDGSVGRFHVFVSGQENIRDLGPLTSDKQFALPLSSGEQLRAAKEGSRVRVEGVVREVEAGRFVVLWDESDQVVVRSGRIAETQAGSRITAYGRLRRQDLQIVLEDGLWMEVGADGRPKGSIDPNLKLRRAVEVLELGLDEAARGYPVELSGIVTWSDPESDFFFLQDATRGVCIHLAHSATNLAPPVGTSHRVIGRTSAGPFAPMVRCEWRGETHSFGMPTPRPITLAQSLGGEEEAGLVEIQGYLRAVEADGRWTVLRLSTPTGAFHARLPYSEAVDVAERHVGAVVRLRGVCVAQTNADGHQDGIELLLSDWRDVDVETAPLSDPFSVDTVSLAALRTFGPLQTPYRWVRTTGTVTYVAENRLILQSAHVGLEIFCRDQAVAKPGDTVEVVGFTGRQRHRVVLREALVREVEAAKAPKASLWSESRVIDVELDNRLVEIDARLEDVLQTGQGTLLYLRAGETRFLGYGDWRSNQALRRGSLLRCVGVYRIEEDSLGRSESFKLFFRNADDISVLKPPPFVTLKHAWFALAVLSLGTGAALLWVGLLRKRVKVQTWKIREHMEHEAKLEVELQKAAKLESLGLLAGGIAHDFNNLLQVVMGNITLVKMEAQAMAVAGDCLEEAERGARRARDLTHQLLTFAKGGEPLRAAEVLPEIVREAAEFVVRGSSVRCDYEFDAGLWAADVDRGQIGQVVHNLVLNAKQAMPDGGVIKMHARNERLADRMVGGLPAGRYVRLALSDTGPGIPDKELDRIFDPYFTTKKSGNGLGLATVHSIVRRHRGYIEVHSEVGHGTVFRIWLPAAENAVVEKVASVAPQPGNIRGRALVMDDEETILRVVMSLLRRFGMDAVGVPDGAEAIRLYQQALSDGQPFTLVIMDLTVPGGMGGREAMAKLRRLDPDIRAIVMSGYSNDPVLANYRDYGFSGMVEKPFDVAILIECVERVLSDAEGQSADARLIQAV